MRSKKVMSIILAIALFLGLLPSSISIQATEPEGTYDWIEEHQTPFASEERTGDVDYRFINDGVLDNSTDTWRPGKTEEDYDYFGYRFSRTYTIKQVVFVAGRKFPDGGWFAQIPSIYILQNDEWIEIESTISPEYDAEAYKTYTFTFDPVECDGVMIYGKPGGDVRFISCAELKVLGEVNQSDIKNVTRYEFERYKEAMNGSTLVAQWMGDFERDTGYSWSRTYQILWLRGDAQNNELSFNFKVALDAVYDVNLQIAKAPDFGNFSFYIDGNKLGEDIDAYSEGLMTERYEKIARIELAAGEHEFKIIANSTDAGRLNAGFDYFELERLEWIEKTSTPIASVVRTGDLALSNINDGNLQNWTDTFEFHKTEDYIDYIGYEFKSTRTVTQLRFIEGNHYVDGGWFREPPTIKALIEGEWTDIDATVTPEYDATAFKEYTYDFEPVECDGIMITGKPGGTVFFVSCAELKVLAYPESVLERPEPETYYSYEDIVKRLYDTESLALIPDGERSAQFTSYDRASKYDSIKKDYVNWDANGDWTGYLYRQDDGGYVIAEMDGPGYINRMWMAYEWSGNLAIYIDDNPEPITFHRFSDVFTGVAFPYQELSYRAVNVGKSMAGLDCYVPITYNQSCRVVLYNSTYDTFGNFSYYIIGYTSLPKTCAVESFTWPLSDKNKAALQQANDILADRTAPSGELSKEIEVSLNKDESKTVYEAESSGAISFIEIETGTSPSLDKSAQYLSEITMSIYWDNEEKPSIYTTLGDFFGTPYGITAYESYISGVKEDGTLYARWFMPYKDGVKIEFCNHSDKAREFKVKLYTAQPEHNINDYARFNSQWNKMTDCDRSDSRHPDSNILTVNGTGRFVGVSMHIYQKANQIWWGEGDEKFFIDGEKFPSWFGTGSEDYFGYAWCQPTIFNKAFHGQSLCEGSLAPGQQLQNAGNKVNYRFHISDSIPFYSSFDGYLEKYFDDRYVEMAATTFYYILKEDLAENPVNLFTLEDRAFNVWEGQKPAYFYEGEELTRYIEPATSGSTTIQDMTYATTDTRKWSGDAQLWWTCKQPNAHTSFTVNLPRKGTYKVKGAFTKSSDYGMLQLYINDTKVGEPMDFFSSGLEITTVEIGQIDLDSGINTVKLEVVGKNDGSTGYFIGLDYLEFVLEKPAVIIGDVNMDEKITVTDVVALRALIMGKPIESEDQFHAADVNEDGVLTVTDVVGLRRIIMGQE